MILYARQFCTSPEDAVQEALVALVEQSPRPDEPLSWLYTTVRFRALNITRAEQRRDKHHRLASEDRDEWFVSDADLAVESRDLERSLQELTTQDREILVARVWGELTFEQIAHVVNLPVSTVHRRYRRTLAMMERSLSGEVDI